MTTDASTPTTTDPPSAATAESILAFRNRAPVEPFELPDGRTVYVHGLTDIGYQQWYDSCAKRTDDAGRERIEDPYSDAKLLLRCVRDADGKAIFSDSHLPQLIELPKFITGPLVARCMKLSAIGGAADEDIAKNYAATLAGGF